jgi:NAD(P)-dependent dehydrogenase (short-subunit alcohol dehydrogenase family)
MDDSRRPVALVTGGSRGIGAGTVLALADKGYDVAFTYRNKTARAEEVAAQAEARGVRALPVGSDITRPEQVDALFAQLKEWAGRLDAVILNASGGLERDLVAADPAYPMRINRDAQALVVDGALPLLRPGGVIVFVTSHWAHLYGQVEQLPAYATVAASKHAGEQALRARHDDFAARGVRLAVVTGDLVEGTITPKLLERVTPGLAAERRAGAGRLPTVEDTAAAIVAVVSDVTLPDGHVVVVGGALDALPRLHDPVAAS